MACWLEGRNAQCYRQHLKFYNVPQLLKKPACKRDSIPIQLKRWLILSCFGQRGMEVTTHPSWHEKDKLQHVVYVLNLTTGSFHYYQLAIVQTLSKFICIPSFQFLVAWVKRLAQGFLLLLWLVLSLSCAENLRGNIRILKAYNNNAKTSSLPSR